MPGFGISPERMKERMNEILSRRKFNERYFDSSVRSIPLEHLMAAIALSGGEAYSEDIEWILKNLFGHEIKYKPDLFTFLDEHSEKISFDSDENGVFWKLDKKNVKNYEESIKRSMRKALGYKDPYSSLEKLFSGEGTLKLWENYKDD